MLPQSHVAYTLAAYEWARRRFQQVPEVDERLLVVAAMGPDLLDKPLAAAYFYRRYRSAVLFAHTLLVHLPLLLYTILRRPAGWPYFVAFIAHAILDRMWYFPDTFYWPLRGWRFTEWRKRGSEQQEISKAYWYAFTRRPELWIWELGGIMAGLWFVWRNQLYLPSKMLTWLKTGRSLGSS